MAMKSGVPQSMRRRVFREGNYRCEDCGLTGREVRFRGGFGYPTPMSGVHLSIDHRVPRSAGGTSERSNLRVLCTRCNTLKGTKMPEVAYA